MTVQQFLTYYRDNNGRVLIDGVIHNWIFDVPFLSSVAHGFDAVSVSSVYYSDFKSGLPFLQTHKIHFDDDFINTSVAFGVMLNGQVLPRLLCDTAEFFHGNSIDIVSLELWCRHAGTDYSSLIKCPLTYLLSHDFRM